MPDLHSSAQNLKQVLTKWRNEGYHGCKDINYVAYVLDGRYKTGDLSAGVSLKTSDAEQIAWMKPIAEQLGFLLFLGDLTCKIMGDGEFDDIDLGLVRYVGHRPKNVRCAFSDYAADVPQMAQEDDRYIHAENLVDLRGEKLVGGLLGVEPFQVVPSKVFDLDENDPDEKSVQRGDTIVRDFCLLKYQLLTQL